MAYKKLSERTWRKKLIEVAESFCQIRECKKCGSPTVGGYCCTFCGDSNPDQTKEQEEA